VEPKRRRANAPLPGPVPPRRLLQAFGADSSASRFRGMAVPSPAPPVARYHSNFWALLKKCQRINTKKVVL